MIENAGVQIIHQHFGNTKLWIANKKLKNKAVSLHAGLCSFVTTTNNGTTKKSRYSHMVNAIDEHVCGYVDSFRNLLMILE